MKRLIALSFAICLSALAHAATQDTITVRVKAMRCAECGHKVKNALRKNPGVGELEFNYERRTVKIAYDPQKTDVDSIYRSIAVTKRYQPTPYSPTEVIRRGYGQRIDDMHCQKCVNRIVERLSQLDGIDSLGPHLDKHYVFIRYDANRTDKAAIRALLNRIGYTPCNYYSSPKIGWLYLNIPAEQATQETIESVMALNGVEDANVNAMRKSLAITYFNDETQESLLIEQIQKAGIQAVVPKPHVCSEEKE